MQAVSVRSHIHGVNMRNAHAGVCVKSFVETCMWMCKTFIVFAHLFCKNTCVGCVFGCFQNPGRSTPDSIGDSDASAASSGGN